MIANLNHSRLLSQAAQSRYDVKRLLRELPHKNRYVELVVVFSHQLGGGVALLSSVRE